MEQEVSSTYMSLTVPAHRTHQELSKDFESGHIKFENVRNQLQQLMSSVSQDK